MAYKVALFDLDGVVLDTESQYSRFWGMIGREVRPDVHDFGDRIKGQTLTQIFDGWLPQDEALRASITERLYAFEDTMEFPFIPGAYEFLKALKEQGVPTAVVTSSNKPKMRQVYQRCPAICDLFTAILTSEDFSASKPDPDCYLRGAARLGATPAESVVFEDSINGLRAARAAGTYVVGLATTNPRATVATLADIVVDDFTQPLNHLFS